MPVRADDWPQWRGPLRDGVWREDGVLEQFPPRDLLCGGGRRRGRVFRAGRRGGSVFLMDRAVDESVSADVNTQWNSRSGVDLCTFSLDRRPLWPTLHRLDRDFSLA